READTQAAGVLGVAAGHERGRLFVTDLDEADAILALAQRFHDAVDPVAWQAEHHADVPIEQAIRQDIRCRSSHVVTSRGRRTEVLRYRNTAHALVAPDHSPCAAGMLHAS